MCGIWLRPETRAETRVFLKSETKTDRKPAVKITLQYKRSSAFCEKGKIARKKFQWLKREIFRFAIFWRKAHRCWSKQAQVTAVWTAESYIGFLYKLCWLIMWSMMQWLEHLTGIPSNVRSPTYKTKGVYSSGEDMASQYKASGKITYGSLFANSQGSSKWESSGFGYQTEITMAS